MNLTAADRQGHIGRHATGAAPLRHGYSGRLPALDWGAAGGPDWEGFLPYGALPHLLDPEEGRVVTANYRSVTDQDLQQLSYAWAAPYRFQRVNQLLEGMADPGPEQFARLQMDVHSNQAERILPKLLAFGFRDPLAVRAAELLRAWDREVRGDSTGAAVFEVFLAVEDVILDRLDSTFWDRKDTPQRETPREILERSLMRTMHFLERRLGRETPPSGAGRSCTATCSGTLGLQRSPRAC